MRLHPCQQTYCFLMKLWRLRTSLPTDVCFAWDMLVVLYCSLSVIGSVGGPVILPSISACSSIGGSCSWTNVPLLKHCPVLLPNSSNWCLRKPVWYYWKEMPLLGKGWNSFPPNQAGLGTCRFLLFHNWQLIRKEEGMQWSQMERTPLYCFRLEMRVFNNLARNNIEADLAAITVWASSFVDFFPLEEKVCWVSMLRLRCSGLWEGIRELFATWSHGIVGYWWQWGYLVETSSMKKNRSEGHPDKDRHVSPSPTGPWWDWWKLWRRPLALNTGWWQEFWTGSAVNLDWSAEIVCKVYWS